MDTPYTFVSRGRKPARGHSNKHTATANTGTGTTTNTTGTTGSSGTNTSTRGTYASAATGQGKPSVTPTNAGATSKSAYTYTSVAPKSAVERSAQHVFGTSEYYSDVPVRNHFKYVNGRPAGAGQMPNMESWLAPYKEKPRTLASIRDMYSYITLEREFPWAKTVRAGVVLIHSNAQSDMPPCPRVLIVYEQPMTYQMAKGNRMETVEIGTRAGFPKGAREPDDPTAFDTAVRELKEETGINVLDPAINARLSGPMIVIPRSETAEVFLWFIMVVDTQPSVSIQCAELTRHEWVSMRSSLRRLGDMTGPTQLLVQALERVNLSSPTQLIPLSEPTAAVSA